MFRFPRNMPVAVVLALAATSVAALRGQDQPELRPELRRIIRLCLQQALEVRDENERITLLTNIAMEQIRARDFQGALETQDHLPESERAHTLNAIAWAQAEIGELAAASQTASTIQDTRVKANTLSTLAISHARRHDFPQALAIAAAIDAYPDVRLRTYQLIAHFQFRAGDKSGAARTLRDAFAWATRALAGSPSHAVTKFAELASTQSRLGDPEGAAATRAQLMHIFDRLPHTRDREAALASAARAYAAAGESPLAREMVGRIRPGAARDAALAQVAIDEAWVGNVPAAQQSIEGIETPAEEAFAREQIGYLQSGQGDTTGALETANAIPDPAMRAEALITIALAQARKRQPGPASLAMARALEAAALAGLEPMTPKFFGKVAEVQAWTGDLFGALQTTQAIQSERERAEAIYTVTRMQSTTGDWHLALTWIEEESSPYVRAQALLGVAGGIRTRIARSNSATK